jgi:phage shock protein A
MKARASALDELIDTGTLDDLTSSGDDIDRELAKINSATNVYLELEQLKKEAGK